MSVVRKSLKQSSDVKIGFQREQHILSLLRCLHHPNIIKLLTAYTIDSTHNFLFPVADGDLNTFFRLECRPPGFETENEVLQALYKLASAIESVHNYFSDDFNVQKFGCHYDLKPGNILFCGGNFILSDFGLSRLSNIEEGSRTLYRNGAEEYMAPECVCIEKDFQSLRVGRSSDIWSFGCILSEMLTYLQKGSIGILEFSQRREITFDGWYTCKMFHNGNKPHNGVAESLATLRNNSIAGTAQHSILDLVNNLLQQEPRVRMSAQSITNVLFGIAQRRKIDAIESLFQPLVAQVDLELDIIYERFKIWSEAAGFSRTYEQMITHERFIDRQSLPQMQIIEDKLSMIPTEIEKMSDIQQNSEAVQYRIYHHLQKLIDDLWDLRSQSQRHEMFSILESRILNTSNADRLESIAQGLGGSSLCERGKLSITAEPKSEILGYERIGLLAAMKTIASALKMREQSSDDMLLDYKQIEGPMRAFHWHSLGRLRKADVSRQQVLIEWLKYDTYWIKHIGELIQRAQDIAACRATTSTGLVFPVLVCAGYFHDVANHAFGIVYSFPTLSPGVSNAVIETEKPWSLSDILSKIKSRRQRPSLDEIFNVAHSLLDVVLTMHRGGWVHKNISAYNIIFFPDRYDSIAEAMKSPYLIGFNYSRLDLKTAFTQGPHQQLEYQHPEYLLESNRFRREYEYYSVGLVLLELALWMTLEKITEDIIGDPEEMRATLLTDYVPMLRTYMGSAYEEAVAICLKGEFGDSSDPTQVRESFEANVLARIAHPSRCYT